MDFITKEELDKIVGNKSVVPVKDLIRAMKKAECNMEEIMSLIKEEFKHDTTIEDADSDVRHRIESNPELLKSLGRAEKDIENEDFYTTEEILDMIDRGEI